MCTHRKTLSVCAWTGCQVKMKIAQFVSSENLHCHVKIFFRACAVTHIVPPWFDYLTIHVNLFMVTLWRDKTFDNYFSVVMRSNWVFLCTCKGEDIQPAKQIISIYFDYQIRNKVTEYIRSHWQNGILNWLFWRQGKINHPSCTGGDKKKWLDLTDVSVTSFWQDRDRQNQNITHIKGRATSYSRVGG